MLVEHNGQAYYAGPAASMGVEARFLDPNYIETDSRRYPAREYPSGDARTLAAHYWLAGCDQLAST